MNDVVLAPAARQLELVRTDKVSVTELADAYIQQIARLNPGKSLWYVGDAVDDARSARQAGVPFVGIAAPSNPRRSELIDLFRAENAIAVLDDINQLEGVLPQ